MNDGSKPQVGAKKPREERVPVMFTKDELDDIESWQTRNRYRTRNDAIRELIHRGLEK